MRTAHVPSRPGSAASRIAIIAALALTAPAAGALESSHALPPKSASEISGPLLTIISLRKQRLRVFDLNGEVTSSRVSSGKPGFDTPTGVFSLLEKNVDHTSNIYDAAMPYMQRLTWSGIALHSGQVPGYRASHGCIRLPHSFAKSLFGITSLGSRVVVTNDEAQPMPFSHRNLFRPLPDSLPIAVVEVQKPATRVASNDPAAGTNSIEPLNEIPRLFGVTPALAEAVADYRAAPERPKTRAQAASAMRETVSRAETNLKIVENSRKSATEAAKAAVLESTNSTKRFAELRQQGERLKAALSAAEAKHVAAQRAFEQLLRGAATATDAAAFDDKEANIEEALLDATVALDAVKFDAARLDLDLATVQAAAMTSETARTRAIAIVQKAVVDLKSAQAALIEAKKDVLRRAKPVSVLISLKAQRIYVRQGFEPVLEAPITISERPPAIGTHVMTAMRYAPNDPDAFDWRLVTAQSPSAAASAELAAQRKKKNREPAPQIASPSGIAALTYALDTIKIPPDILEIISERARPGASLIVTDRDLKPSENGSGTEFVLLTR